ncbi:YegP family protein [Lacisediminimonas profundi]|uniref:YegP family protein n=1 Tax=Lacisediminimonas profundi TaxID=2603856 RepID=UPI00124AE6B3|nr:YegP family protein [Lacisediminimonas profundi]
MSTWYELTNSSDGQFRFVLKSDEGGTLLTSELYKTKSAAENGIESVQGNCQNDARYEKKSASNGKFYFNLKAANHQVIGTSGMHASGESCASEIEKVKAGGATQTIKDLTMPLKSGAGAPASEKRL